MNAQDNAPQPAQPSALQIENLKGAISLAIEGLKALILINGGAAIGILTFYGNTLKDGNNLHIAKCTISTALNTFGFGVGSAIFAFILAYLSQLISATAQSPNTAEIGLRYASIALATSSAACFIWGVCLAGISFG